MSVFIVQPSKFGQKYRRANNGATNASCTVGTAAAGSANAMHGTLREMVDRHRLLPRCAGLQRPPTSSGGIRQGRRRRRAGVLAAARRHPGSRASRGRLVLPGARHRGPLRAPQPRPRGCGVARHCFHPGSPVHRAPPVLARHVPIGATALHALVFGLGSSCRASWCSLGGFRSPPTGPATAHGPVGPLVVRSVAERADKIIRAPEGNNDGVTRRHVGERRRGWGHGFLRWPRGARIWTRPGRRRGDKAGHASFQRCQRIVAPGAGVTPSARAV